MTYNANRLYLIGNAIGRGVRHFAYFTDDSMATVLGAGYFADAVKHGAKLGDVVDVYVGTINTAVSATPSTAAAGSVSEFSALTAAVQCQVSSVSGNAATVKSLPQVIGASAASLVGFYGAAPVVQPATSLQAAVTTSGAVSISATQFGFATAGQANGLVTLLNQLRADLVTLGLIKGAA